MSNTLRATTISLDGDPTSPAEANVIHPVANSCPDTTPHHNKSASLTRQGRYALHSHKRRPQQTFAAILQSVLQCNVVRLKNRGFVGNRIAKLVTGHSQRLCYQVKNAAISALVKHGAASLLSLEPSNSGPILGLTFVGGGRLHTKANCQETHACLIIQDQFAATLRSGSYFPAGGRGESL